MSTIKNTKDTNVSENVEQMGHLYIVSDNEKWHFLINLNIHLSYGQTTLFLDIYPR